MRTSTTILDEFDDPLGELIDSVDSTVSSVRQRIPIELLLDIRKFAIGVPATYDETTPVHIVGFSNEKAICYNDSTGVMSAVSDLSKLVVTV